jgi:hypothetical protein
MAGQRPTPREFEAAWPGANPDSAEAGKGLTAKPKAIKHEGHEEHKEGSGPFVTFVFLVFNFFRRVIR